MSRLLAECGKALYGPRWHSDLARDLGVSDRTVRRWASGTHDVPDGALVDLLRLTRERGIVLGELARRLETTPK